MADRPTRGGGWWHRLTSSDRDLLSMIENPHAAAEEGLVYQVRLQPIQPVLSGTFDVRVLPTDGGFTVYGTFRSRSRQTTGGCFLHVTSRLPEDTDECDRFLHVRDGHVGKLSAVMALLRETKSGVVYVTRLEKHSEGASEDEVRGSGGLVIVLLRTLVAFMWRYRMVSQSSWVLTSPGHIALGSARPVAHDTSNLRRYYAAHGFRPIDPRDDDGVMATTVEALLRRHHGPSRLGGSSRCQSAAVRPRSRPRHRSSSPRNAS